MSVRTVLGPIPPEKLGKTLTHEHIRMDYNCCFRTPSMGSHKEKAHLPMEIQNLGYIRQYPYSSYSNLSFGKEDLQTMIKEVGEYKNFGGDTLVEVTTCGIKPDFEFLKKVSEATGVNIVCGTGYYLAHTQTEEVKELDIDSLVKNMVLDLTEGRNGIMAGCIGEVACNYPLDAFERKSLIASVKAQAKTGAPLIIHPGRHEVAPFEIIDILKEQGADISKTVMSHLDRTLTHSNEVLLKFANYSTCYLEFDLFGMEVSHYQNNLDFDFPSDAQRISCIKMLIEHGFEDRIVIAHDVHTRHRLIKYGGHGYGHILENVIPKMLRRGITESQINKILVENPRRWLAY